MTIERSTSAEAAPAPPAAPGKLVHATIWLFGIVLPAVTMAIELSTQMCAESYVDPLPTMFHAALVIAVPVANLLGWLALSQRIFWRWQVSALLGIALGVEVLYTMVFLPIMPIGALVIFAYGFGLLPLSPLLALIATLVLTTRLRRIARADAGTSSRALLYGMAGAFAAFALLAARGTLTSLALARATSDDEGDRKQGIAWLRRLHAEDAILRRCYTRGSGHGVLTDLTLGAAAGHVQSDVARALYYRVTGRPFDSVPPPRLKSMRGDRLDVSDWDFDQAGSSVGGVVRGLALTSSRIDGSIDADAALSYWEWTLELSNHGLLQREARAELDLPTEGVVSRATLWIDGEPREAAFGARSQVRSAYQQVVRQVRDPLLVTTAGPGRVLVQAFPIPVGGTMKFRIGVSAPISLSDLGRGALRMPHFAARNFAVPASTKHSIWLESKGTLRAEGWRSETTPEGAHGLRAEVSDDDETVVTVERDPALTTASAPYDRGVVRQALRLEPLERSGRIAVVVDGSSGMRSAAQQVIAGLSAAPAAQEIRLFLAGDMLQEAGRDGWDDAIAKASFVGGADDVPALVRAWDWVSEMPRGRILWVHGAKPVKLSSLEPLLQRWERRASGALVEDLQIGRGPNVLLDGLPERFVTRHASGAFSIRDTVDRALGVWRGARSVVRAVRDRATAEEGVPTSGHLVKLWAHEETARLVASGNDYDREAALELAKSQQLVTSLTGAVVLATHQEYEQAHLTPADPKSVPTIPEPETWGLLVVGGAVLLVVMSRFTRQAAA